jgi:uncharacterized RDD family membrane protein YckC
VTNGRDVVIGLAVRTGRIGASTGRFVLVPARAVGRSAIAAPFRDRAEGLAETGRIAGVDARRRLEMVAEEVLATPEAEQVVDGVFAGALPEAIARSLVEHRVVERVVVEALASAELEAEGLSARESERVVAQVLASPALERALADALESRITLDFTERLLDSPAFRLALLNVLSSPEVRAALTGQSKSLADEIASGLRHRVYRLDDTAERGPRRLFHRRPRAEVAAAGEASSVAYGGFATRGVALTVDAALAAIIFLTGSAVVGLVGSLVWHPHWQASVVAGLLAVAGLLVNILYFAGFWSTAGQTPGMRLMHLRVVDASGSPPGLGRSLVRLVGLTLAILLLFTGFLPALVDDRRRALQDFLASTLVLYTRG